jgi:cytochrome P450
MGLLSVHCLEAQLGRIWRAFHESTEGWVETKHLGLLSQMRDLVIRASSCILFGNSDVEHLRLATDLRTYFYQRREASANLGREKGKLLDKIETLGNSLDRELRRYVRECRQRPGLLSAGVIRRLAGLELASGRTLSEDEVIGHTNVLFISSTEPVAVSLTWVILVLSQLPKLLHELRDELKTVLNLSEVPKVEALGGLVAMDRVINETFRLLPPNAFMVRITTKPTSLNGVRLPKGCEVIVCPFLSHRDGEHFERPDEFHPDRWKEAAPSPFAYFPFGAGGHACVGRILATHLIKLVLAFLLPRYDILLAGDQDIDWQVHIMFMPRTDPAINVFARNAAIPSSGGRLGGRVGHLLGFKPSLGASTNMQY